MAKSFGPTEKQRFVNLTSTGRPPALAAEDVGVTWATVRKHLREDPEFGAQVEQATLIVDSRVQEVAYDAAVSGDDMASTWKWLERRQRHEWADTKNVQHTVSGPGGGPVMVGALVGEALRGVLVAPDTRDSALQLARSVPIIEAEARES
jgi:predicted transcriptional regulator